VRPSLPTLVQQLGSTLTAAEATRAINDACGINPRSIPTPAQTFSWSEILIELKEQGYKVAEVINYRGEPAPYTCFIKTTSVL
jgi:hypothetical protein